LCVAAPLPRPPPPPPPPANRVLWVLVKLLESQRR
jgi:hypothetical protein